MQTYDPMVFWHLSPGQTSRFKHSSTSDEWIDVDRELGSHANAQLRKQVHCSTIEVGQLISSNKKIEREREIHRFPQSQFA